MEVKFLEMGPPINVSLVRVRAGRPGQGSQYSAFFTGMDSSDPDFCVKGIIIKHF